MTQWQSLDQRYLKFEARTRLAFKQYPQCEPLRQFIFRDLLTQARPFGWRDSAKRWLRPLVRRQHTRPPLPHCDILIFIEGTREVICQSLLPVFCELNARGERVALVALNGPSDLPQSAVILRYGSVLFLPAWARPAWKGLCRAEQHLAQPALARSFFSSCSVVQGLLNEVGRILDVTSPRVVVMASTQLIGGAALVVAAQSKQIRTVLLQHGVLQPVYVPMLADRMCTWGRSSNEILLRFGTDHRRLRALGSPRHDAMRPAGDGQAKRHLLTSLVLEDRPTLVFFSNGNDMHRNGSAPVECARWLEGAAKRYRGKINIIVRLHPNEDGSLYRKDMPLVVVKDRPDLAVLLEGSDRIASLCSTTMLDALLYHKPVWHFHADGWPELATNWQEGLAHRIASEDQLCAMIEQVIQKNGSEDRKHQLVESVFANHGRATQAVADYILSEAKESHQPITAAAVTAGES